MTIFTKNSIRLRRLMKSKWDWGVKAMLFADWTSHLSSPLGTFNPVRLDSLQIDHGTPWTDVTRASEWLPVEFRDL